MGSTLRYLGLAPVLLVLISCSPTYERHAAPPERMTDAVIPGIPEARHWRSAPPANLIELRDELIAQRQASGVPLSMTMLSLSGGADDGAYGAGVLAAWSDRRDRPEFTVVTGVSTGALTAPFVFLGPEYDRDLRTLYGGLPADSYFAKRPLLDILGRVSAADPAPLEALIAHYADDEFLAAIAREHRRGRRLYVQSTSLDAQEAVIWDLGAIAASRAPNAPELFRKALMASASVPGAFPPVMIDVELQGTPHDEMHVDGGVVSESTVLAEWQVEIEHVAHRQDRRRLYVIRNGRISPEPKEVPYSLPSIGARAVSTLIKNQGTADLLTAYDIARLREAEFNVTWIGDDFKAAYPGPFDPGYMKALYQYGYDRMARGEAWSSRPPQLQERQRATDASHAVASR